MAPHLFLRRRFFALIFVVWVAAWPCTSRAADGFTLLGTPVRQGGLIGCLVGPDGKGGEALYFNFNQCDGVLFLVQVNPDTGEARQYNAPEGPGAHAFIVGPDNRIYLGTWSGALILAFDPQKPEEGIKVIGKPSASEDYIWQFDNGPDGWIYGCTYPQAKLIRYQPESGKMEDLGRMHTREMYAHSLAVGLDGKVYVDIGTAEGDLVMYDPATGQHRSILPQEREGSNRPTVVHVSKRADGNVYATFGTNFVRLKDGVATKTETRIGPPTLTLKDGRIVSSFGRGEFTLFDPKTGQSITRRFHYHASGDRIFTLGNGPGENVYGSSILPLEVFRHDPKSGTCKDLGAMPGGEVYSILEHAGKLYLCSYGGAIMNRYDPAKSWNWGTAKESNPVSFGGVGDGHLRPRAMIYGPGGMIYVGSEPPYGELGGAMGVWDPQANKTVENYRHLVKNQSIVSLAWDKKDNLIWGGSGDFGGGGTKPAEKEAVFFAFDPVKKKKIFEAAIEPGAKEYPATLALDGRVLTTVRDKMFIFDPARRMVEKTLHLDGAQLEISLGMDARGRVVGLTNKGIYVIDPASLEIVHSEKAPVRIDCGFAITDGAVFFGSGAELWRYRLP